VVAKTVVGEARQGFVLFSLLILIDLEVKALDPKMDQKIS
jgi:hypothetical protein